MPMTLQVLTLFPEVVEAFCNASIVGRARQAGVVEITFTNFRDFATDVHRSVDDKPFGGGPGMVLKPEPVFDAVAHAEAADPTPATRPIDPLTRPGVQMPSPTWEVE